MKKALLLLSVFVIAASAMSAQYLACSFGSQIGGADWDPANPALELTDGDGDGIYTFTTTLTADISALANEGNGWKVTDGTWGNSFPGQGNFSFVGTNGEEVTFSYDLNDYSADGWYPSTGFAWSSNHSEYSAQDVSFVGSFEGASWTLGQFIPTGAGRYKSVVYNPTADATLEFKTGSLTSWDCYAIAGSNQSISVTAGEDVYMNLDTESNRMKASIGTSPVSDWTLYSK